MLAAIEMSSIPDSLLADVRNKADFVCASFGSVSVRVAHTKRGEEQEIQCSKNKK